MSSEGLPKKNTTKGYQFLVIFIAVLFGLFLANLPIDVFYDRENYISYVDDSPIILLRYLNNGFLAVLSNEPIWLGLNILLNNTFSTEIALRIIIGIPASITAYHVLKYDPKYFVLLIFFLLMPPVLKNYIVHLRQGVAISIFLVGWFASNKKVSFFLIFLTPFIHASFFFILMLLGVDWYLKKNKYAIHSKVVIYSLLGITIGLTLSILSKYFDARQSENYDFTMAEASGLGFFFWSIILVIYMTSNKVFVRKHSFEIGIIIFYLSTYFLVEITARVFQSGLILVLLSGLSLTSKRRFLFALIFLTFFLISYLSRFGDSYFGWGI